MTLPASKLLVLALAGIALGACTVRDPARTSSIGPRYATLDAMLDGRASAVPSSASSDIPARVATPVAVMPAWIGRPLRLRERDEPDAFEQVVSLTLAPRSEARENLILLRLPRTPRAASGEAGAGIAMGGPPSEAGIRAELAAIFPDVPMQVVTRPAKNSYGPYGLAVGRSQRGARCLYAWQWIEDAPALDPTVTAPGPLSLRVRICRDDITLEAMAAAMNQLKLVPRFDGTPFAAVRATRGRSFAPRQTVARARIVRRRRAIWEGVPRDGRDGMRDENASRVVATEARATSVARLDRAPAIVATPLPAGRRYLGVAETPAAQPDAAREFARDPAPGPTAMRGTFVGAAPPPQTGTLSADLPPEALRGPSARPSGRL